MTPRKGDKVRVTLDCEYIGENGFGQTLIKADGGETFYLPGTTAVEVIEDLRPGDVYRDRDGDLGVYVADEERPWLLLTIMGKVRRDGMTEPLPDLILVRPLTLLVRDGKPVTS
jgi:hypothetical protein